MPDLVTKMLKAIEKNSRFSIEELASEIGTSVEETIDLVAKMEREHIICGYHSIINWDKTNNETVTALIEVRATPQRDLGFDQIARRIYRFEEVDSVYLMSGGYDFLVLIAGKSMKEISRFVFEKLSTIGFVSSTTTHFVLKKYKDHGVAFEEPHEDRREMNL